MARKVGEWVELIEPCERLAVAIAVTTHGRCLRPGQSAGPTNAARGRRRLRVRDPPRHRNASGETLPPTPPPDCRTGAPVWLSAGVRPGDPAAGRQEVDPVEAPIVVEMFERVAAGHSMISLVKDFKRREGSVNRNGTPFHMQDDGRCSVAGAVFVCQERPRRRPGRGRLRPTGRVSPAVPVARRCAWPALVE